MKNYYLQTTTPTTIIEDIREISENAANWGFTVGTYILGAIIIASIVGFFFNKIGN